MADIAQLAAAAGQAASAGRWDEAEALWRQVQSRDPDHPEAAFSLGVHAMRRADFSSAVAHFARAQRVRPDQPVFSLALAQAAEASGDFDAQRNAIDAALAADAYFLPALLAKAAYFERQGAGTSAAMTYKNALIVAPPKPHWPADMRGALEHAERVANAYGIALEDRLKAALATVTSTLPAPLQERWREASSIMAGRSRPYHADCNQITVPRLPAQPFFERAAFPWAAALEARTDAIRAEMLAAFAQDGQAWAPYIQYKPGEPVNQWRDLNHSQRWSTFHLYRGGEPVHENLARCPQTAAALAQVDMADIAGLCPNAMFSVLAPHTVIPPHHGETNARLVAHLPLVVPPKCTYRVGFDHREWREGELLIFDDTIEHTARNDGDEPRVVLIFDVWNPYLTVDERAVVGAMVSASRAFHAG
jgi:aspartyl/asparaginyl beta-hydroxylase (cupin superfamily)